MILPNEISSKVGTSNLNIFECVGISLGTLCLFRWFYTTDSLQLIKKRCIPAVQNIFGVSKGLFFIQEFDCLSASNMTQKVICGF